MNIIKFKKKLNKAIDIIALREENKLLKTQIKLFEKERLQLIDLKNRYLSELRVKNLEIGRIKKKLGDKENE